MIDIRYTCEDCGAKMYTPYISTQPKMIVRCGACYIEAMKAKVQ